MWRSHICGKDCDNYLESFFDCMCEGFALHKIICDDQGNPIDYIFLEVNTAFQEITSLNKNDIIGKSVTEIFSDIDPSWIRAYGDVALAGKSVQFESYFKQLDKHFKISAFSPAMGQFITFFSDITEIKKAHELLKIHHILFNNAQDIILYVKKDGSIIDANMNAITTYGYTYKELTKMNIMHIRHSSTFKSFEMEMAASDKNGIVFECIHVKKDGTSIPVEVSAKTTLVDNEHIRIHIVRDITERKVSEEKIKFLANYDSLTGIPNRGYLMSQLDLRIKQSKEFGTKFALMLFDIDKFKRINDVYGHDVGDIVLMNTAARVQKCVGDSGFLGRLGGDEFVIIVPIVNGNESYDIVHCILKELEKPLKLTDLALQISISIGIALFPEDAADKANIMINADKAMYLAKQEGGNGFRFF